MDFKHQVFFGEDGMERICSLFGQPTFQLSLHFSWPPVMGTVPLAGRMIRAIFRLGNYNIFQPDL